MLAERDSVLAEREEELTQFALAGGCGVPCRGGGESSRPGAGRLLSDQAEALAERDSVLAEREEELTQLL